MELVSSLTSTGHCCLSAACLVRKLVMPPAVEAKGKQLHHTGIFYFLSPEQGGAGLAAVIKVHSGRFCFVVQCWAIWSGTHTQPLNLVWPSASCWWPQSAGQSLTLRGLQAIWILTGLLWGSSPDSFKHKPSQTVGETPIALPPSAHGLRGTGQSQLLLLPSLCHPDSGSFFCAREGNQEEIQLWFSINRQVLLGKWPMRGLLAGFSSRRARC